MGYGSQSQVVWTKLGKVSKVYLAVDESTDGVYRVLGLVLE